MVMNALDLIDIVRVVVPRRVWAALSAAAAFTVLLIASRSPELLASIVMWIGEQRTEHLQERVEEMLRDLARPDLPHRPLGPRAV